MISSKISFRIAKYLTVLLCLITILLTTPLGSRLTISLLNTLDGFHFDYKAGALVRDIELHALTLNFTSLNIQATDLAANIDFSCVWKKTLCVESLKADSFLLSYQSTDSVNESNSKSPVTHDDIATDIMFTMPFAIDAQQLDINHSQIIINQTLIDIKELSTKLIIKGSAFVIQQPKAEQVSVFISHSDEKNGLAIPLSSHGKSKSEDNAIFTIVNNLPDISLPIALDIQKLTVSDIKIIEYNNENISKSITKKSLTNKQIPSDIKWHSTSNQLTAYWVKNKVKIDHLVSKTHDYAVNNAKGLLNLSSPYPLSLQADTHIDNLSFWPEIANSEQKVSLKGSLDNLTLTISSKGSLVLQSTSHINLIDTELPFSIQLNAEKLPLPLSLAQYATPSTLYLNASGNLHKQSITLSSQVNSHGYYNAKLDLMAKHQQGIISLSQFNFKDKKSDSQLSIKGHISIPPSNISWDLVANSSGFTLPIINVKQSNDLNNTFILPFEQLSGRVLGHIESKGLWNHERWNASVINSDISGTINDSSLLIKGDITIDSRGYLTSNGSPTKNEQLNENLNTLTFQFNDSELILETLQSESWQLNGKLNIENLQQWYTPAKGSFNSNFSIKGDQDNPRLTLESEFNELLWQPAANSGNTSSIPLSFYSPNIKVSGNYQPLSDHKASLLLKGSTLQMLTNDCATNTEPALAVEALTLNITGDINQQHVELDWQGAVAGTIAFDSQWYNSQKKWQSKISKLALTYENITWQNDKIFALNADVDKQELFIESHCFQGQGINLCLPESATLGNSGDVSLDLGIDLALIDHLLLPEDIQLTSKVSGKLNAYWSKINAISANAALSLSQGNVKVIDEYNIQQVSQWSQGKLVLTSNKQHLKSELRLLDEFNNDLINIDSTLSFIDDWPIDANIMLQQFNLQPFQSFIGSIVNLQGSVSALLAVKGNAKSPSLNGSITLEQGELTLRDNPNRLKKINATIQIDENVAKLDGGFYLEENEANITGELAFKDSLSLNIDLIAKQLPLIFPPQLTMKVSPALNFSLVNKTLLVSGNIDVLEGSYNIEKLPEGSITLSDDVIIVDDNGKEIFKEASTLALKTDVSVNIDRAFKISGQGLHSNLFGQLQISQEQKQPLQLFGSINSDKGTYQAYGQRLGIEKGEITFNGPMKNPYLNLRASRHIKAEDIEVGLEVTGLADALNIQLFSTPTMESAEMLSYLVRGRGVDAGGVNGSVAASMLIGFGVTNSVGLFDKIEELPLISNIAIDTESDGDVTQATISGYLGNRIYLKYGIGIEDPISELTVRMYLLNRLWLEVVSGIEQSSDIYYSFDIE